MQPVPVDTTHQGALGWIGEVWGNTLGEIFKYGFLAALVFIVLGVTLLPLFLVMWVTNALTRDKKEFPTARSLIWPAMGASLLLYAMVYFVWFAGLVYHGALGTGGFDAWFGHLKMLAWPVYGTMLYFTEPQSCPHFFDGLVEIKTAVCGAHYR